MIVELDDEHTKCSICITEFSCDRDSQDPDIRQHLPVLSSSQRCDHWFCHGCVLREQQRVAEENNTGKIPKWIKCMHCREKTSFNPAEPKYHRLLIDFLARAQKHAVDQVNMEETKRAKMIQGPWTPDETDCWWRSIQCLLERALKDIMEEWKRFNTFGYHEGYTSMNDEIYSSVWNELFGHLIGSSANYTTFLLSQRYSVGRVPA